MNADAEPNGKDNQHYAAADADMFESADCATPVRVMIPRAAADQNKSIDDE